MIGTIICEVGTIMCDISIINVRFYLLEVRYPHGYCKITLNIHCIPHMFFKKIMYPRTRYDTVPVSMQLNQLVYVVIHLQWAFLFKSIYKRDFHF
jgi:hypothetical protein